MPPRTTIWPLDPHTRAKHDILRAYLDAWFPILAKHHGRIIYYDGFAGPGRYSAGEEGSPLIALRAALQHRERLPGEVVFVFVEEANDRADSLQTEINALALPPNFRCTIVRSDFETALRSTLDRLDRENAQMAPTFALVDPFGVSGLPFELIARLLARPHCEVLVTFMTETIKRFVTVDEVRDKVPGLIGHTDAVALIAGAADRVARARELYQASLRAVVRFVRYFEMRNDKNIPIYDLFFATNHPLGHEKMKEAMWRVDATGAYSFSDGVDPNQTTMFRANPAEHLAPAILQAFRGQVVDASVVLSWVGNETAYLEKHGRAALGLLEQTGINGSNVTVDARKLDGKPRKAGTFPKGVTIRFPSA